VEWVVEMCAWGPSVEAPFPALAMARERPLKHFSLPRALPRAFRLAGLIMIPSTVDPMSIPHHRGKGVRRFHSRAAFLGGLAVYHTRLWLRFPEITTSLTGSSHKRFLMPSKCLDTVTKHFFLATESILLAARFFS